MEAAAGAIRMPGPPSSTPARVPRRARSATGQPSAARASSTVPFRRTRNRTASKRPSGLSKCTKWLTAPISRTHVTSRRSMATEPQSRGEQHAGGIGVQGAVGPDPAQPDGAGGRPRATGLEGVGHVAGSIGRFGWNPCGLSGDQPNRGERTLNPTTVNTTRVIGTPAFTGQVNYTVRAPVGNPTGPSPIRGRGSRRGGRRRRPRRTWGSTSGPRAGCRRVRARARWRGRPPGRRPTGRAGAGRRRGRDPTR